MAKPGSKEGCSAFKANPAAQSEWEGGSGKQAQAKPCLFGGSREGEALGGKRCGGSSCDVLGKCGGRASGKSMNPHTSLKGGEEENTKKKRRGRRLWEIVGIAGRSTCDPIKAFLPFWCACLCSLEL